MWLFTVPSGSPQLGGDLPVREVTVEGELEDAPLRLAQPGELVGDHELVGDGVDRCRHGLLGDLVGRLRGDLALTLACRPGVGRLVPRDTTSQPARVPLDGSNRSRPRHAATKTCCVTSSASAGLPRERNASVCTSADHLR
jgi:hypothetical protein